MIKKTFETIRRNPIIILFFGIVFVMLLVTRFINAEATTNTLFDENFKMVDLYAVNELYWKGQNISLVLQGILIFAPILYYISICGEGNPQKGWYAKGLKRGWWRYILVGAVVYIVNFLVSKTIISITFPLSHDLPFLMPSIVFVLTLPIYTYHFIAFILYFAISPVMAEKQFGSGLSRISTLAKKYFWKLLGVYALCQAIVIIASLGTQYLFSFRPWIIISSSLAVAVTGMFLYTYSMNLYIEQRQKLELWQKG